MKVDILTDEDVHKEGASLLNKYKIVLTGHHPEYMSEQQMNATMTIKCMGEGLCT